MARTPLRETITAQEEQIEGLIKANEQVWNSYAMLERRVEELSYIDLNNVLDASDEVIPQRMRVQTINRIRRLRHENPMAKQSIKLSLRFVLGKGVTYEVKDDQTRTIVDSFWGDPVNQVIWTSHFAMNTNFDELLTDGEQFIGLFPAPGEQPYVRLGIVPMEEVTNILYDPNNGRLPLYYRRAYRTRVWDATLNNNVGGWKDDPGAQLTVKYYRDFRVTDEYLAYVKAETGFSIPDNLLGEGVIKHRMINPVKMRTGFRGLSELFSSREWFRVFKEFMEDRGAINAAANALAYTRKIAGTPADVSRISGKLGNMAPALQADQPLSPSSFRRPLPGSIYDSNRSDLQPIRADTGAPGAAADAAMIRSTAGAGTGTPDHYFGGTHAGLAAAQTLEVAVVKGFEDYQTYLRNDLREIIEYVLAVARDVPISEVADDAGNVALKFPPIMTQDIVKWVTGFAQWEQQVAPGNRAVRSMALREVASVLGVQNIDIMWAEIEAEEKRIADEQDKQKQLQLDNQQKALDAPAVAPGQPFGGPPQASKPGADGNGNGQKATTGPNEQGQSPQIARLAKGRPPGDPSKRGSS